MVERGALEKRYAVTLHRGFESHPLRQKFRSGSAKPYHITRLARSYCVRVGKIVGDGGSQGVANASGL